ncbi:Os04g0382250 [Oryza sativa Japonica Group]|uniref:Os04g0382250 protein n=1 Tax=Oryza sativa subsp. japonica TaxID=39947 RepID=A0A0P0W9F3_ORYSJ|nr:Os04g0382250 [Oryza sativa Japonica Group]
MHPFLHLVIQKLPLHALHFIDAEAFDPEHREALVEQVTSDATVDLLELTGIPRAVHPLSDGAQIRRRSEQKSPLASSGTAWRTMRWRSSSSIRAIASCTTTPAASASASAAAAPTPESSWSTATSTASR